MKRENLPELPHSAEAQDAIIGALLSDPEQTLQWTGQLQPEDFFDPFSATAYRAILDLSARGAPIDRIAVYERMQAIDSAVDQDDMKSLTEISAWRLSEANFRSYVRIVVDHRRLRELARIGLEVSALGYERSDADKHINTAQMMLAKLATVRAKADPQHVKESLPAYLQHLAELSEGKSPAISTGLGGLDKILSGGLRRGEVTVIGARPKHGKTALSLAMARNVALRAKALFLSQEMPITALMHRHTAALGGIDLSDIVRADPGDQPMWRRVIDAAEKLGELNLVHDEQCALTLIDIRRKAIATRRQHGLDVMFVDFLQLMNGGGEESRNRELDVIVNGIKALAMNLDIAIVVLSQMSRDADRHFGAPTMTHLRDSGAIEAAADQVLLLFTDHAHPLSKKDPAFEGYSEIHVAAHRNGPTGVVPLEFIGRFQQFGDWIRPRPVSAKQAAGGFE